MGLIGAAFGLGFTLGPAIGGLLSHYSIAAPFLFASGLALFNAILAFIRLPESLSAEHRVSPEERAPISQVFKHGWHLPALMGSYFFSIAGFAIMTTIFALFTEARFGFNSEKIGEVFAFIGFIGIIVQGGLLRQLLKRQSEKSLAVTGAILLVVGMALLPGVTGLASLMAVAAVIGIGNSLTTPTLNGLASRSAERSWQGRVIGLMQSSGSLARCIGPFIAGELLLLDVDKLGHPLATYGRTPCWAASFILAISLIITLTLPAKPITAAT
jgi:MFS family permease